ncbi:hypothetical protein [Desulfocicer niacini]
MTFLNPEIPLGLGMGCYDPVGACVLSSIGEQSTRQNEGREKCPLLLAGHPSRGSGNNPVHPPCQVT